MRDLLLVKFKAEILSDLKGYRYVQTILGVYNRSTFIFLAVNP